MVTFGHLCELALEVYVIYLCSTMPCACKIEALTVRCPAVVVNVAVEYGLFLAIGVFGDVFAFSGSEVHDAQAVQVALVTVVLHAEPSNLLAVG